MKRLLVSVVTAGLLVSGAFASAATKAESNKAVSEAKAKVVKEQKELNKKRGKLKDD